MQVITVDSRGGRWWSQHQVCTHRNCQTHLSTHWRFQFQMSHLELHSGVLPFIDAKILSSRCRRTKIRRTSRYDLNWMTNCSANASRTTYLSLAAITSTSHVSYLHSPKTADLTWQVNASSQSDPVLVFFVRARRRETTQDSFRSILCYIRISRVWDHISIGQKSFVRSDLDIPNTFPSPTHHRFAGLQFRCRILVVTHSVPSTVFVMSSWLIQVSDATFHMKRGWNNLRDDDFVIMQFVEIISPAVDPVTSVCPWPPHCAWLNPFLRYRTHLFYHETGMRGTSYKSVASQLKSQSVFAQLSNDVSPARRITSESKNFQDSRHEQHDRQTYLQSLHLDGRFAWMKILTWFISSTDRMKPKSKVLSWLSSLEITWWIPCGTSVVK